MKNKTQEEIDKYYTRRASSSDFMNYGEINKAREYLIKNLKILEGEKVLEIGIGSGRNLPYFTEKTTLFGLEKNEAMLRTLKYNSGKNTLEKLFLVRGDGKNICFGREFDVVVMAYVLSAIPKSELVLKEARRILKPKGRMGILDFGKTPKNLPESNGFVNFNLKKLIKKQTGFKEKQVLTFTDIVDLLGKRYSLPPPQEIYLLEKKS